MRRILNAKLGEQERLLMVILSLVLFCLPLVMILRSIPEEDLGGTLPRGAIVIACAVFVGGGILGYYAVAFLIRVLGGMFGGTASAEESRTVSAWSQLVTGMANAAVMLLAFVLPEALGTLLRVVMSIAGLIIFSAFLAEAHGFRSVPRVAGIALCIMLGLGMLLNAMLFAGLPR